MKNFYCPVQNNSQNLGRIKIINSGGRRLDLGWTHNIQMIYYRAVPLKPIILLTDVTQYSINKNKTKRKETLMDSTFMASLDSF